MCDSGYDGIAAATFCWPALGLATRGCGSFQQQAVRRSRDMAHVVPSAKSYTTVNCADFYLHDTILAQAWPCVRVCVHLSKVGVLSKRVDGIIWVLAWGLILVTDSHQLLSTLWLSHNSSLNECKSNFKNNFILNFVLIEASISAACS